MKIKYFFGLGVSLAVLMLSGCGGGDGGVAPVATTINGMAAKGPINGGTVKVFAIRSGQVDRSSPIGQGQSDSSGNYSVPVGVFSGPVMVEVTGGTFSDEATGAVVTLNSSTFLRAVVPDTTAGATTTVAVTPLTELAYKKALGTGEFTAVSIDQANKAIAAIFNLTEIVAKLPVAGGADDAQKNYAFALGVFSQFVHDNANTAAGEHPEEALQRLLNAVGDDVKNTGNLSLDDLNKMTTAVTNFKNSGRDKSGGTITLTAPTSGLLKITTGGTTSIMGAIDLTVILPAGAKVSADATGETTAGVVKASGVAAGSNTLATAKFTAATTTAPAQLRIGLINPTGFGLGECVTIKFDLDTGASFPAAATAFTVTGFTAKDITGALLNGITVAPASLSVGG
jgi:hypothetical protein